VLIEHLGGPFRVNVDSTKGGSFVSAYGPGLEQGTNGDKLEFYIARTGEDGNDVFLYNTKYRW